MGCLDVIARPAVVPQQPPGVRRDPPGCPHELRGVRAEQDVAALGDRWEHGLQPARAALIILDHENNAAGQFLPGREANRGLRSEPREPPGKGQACAHP
jgi:hypothetical protein